MTDSGDLVLDGAPSGLPPAISEALPQEIMTAIADHARAANEAGYERGLRRCVPGGASPVDYSKAEAAFKVLEAAILSALPREEPQEEQRVIPEGGWTEIALQVREDALNEAAQIADTHDDAGTLCCCDKHLCDVGAAIRDQIAKAPWEGVTTDAERGVDK